MRRRADGRWEGRLALVVDGRMVRRGCYGRTRAEVLHRLRLTAQTLRSGLAAPESSQTLGHYLQEWLHGQRSSLRPATVSLYEMVIRRHLQPEMGSVRLDRLTVAQVQGMLRRLSENGLAPRSVGHIRAVLRSALNEAVRQELVPRNVASLARPPRPPQRVIEPFTPEECSLILGCAPGRDPRPSVAGHRSGAQNTEGAAGAPAGRRPKPAGGPQDLQESAYPADAIHGPLGATAAALGPG